MQADIDAVVQDSVETGFVLYRIDEAAVAQARPNVIVTQDLCSVCAPTSSDVATALLGVCGVPSNSSAAGASSPIDTPVLPLQQHARCVPLLVPGPKAVNLPMETAMCLCIAVSDMQLC